MTNGLSDHDLNGVGVLRRRAIEARILAPVVAALGAEFGRERVLAIVAEAIREIARSQGAALAAQCGSASLPEFAASLERWKADDALQMTVLEASEDRLAFNVTRCRYAEMYREAGIPELGAILSCNRDGALIQGFNPAIRLQRAQTLMEGATHCDFRYEQPRSL